MNTSTAASFVVGTVAAATNGSQSAPTARANATTLDHSHYATIEIDLDQCHAKGHLPFWKGYVLERDDAADSVIVGFARALNAAAASRTCVIVRLNEMVRRNGNLLGNTEDMTTGEPIDGMPFLSRKTVQNVSPILPAER